MNQTQTIEQMQSKFIKLSEEATAIQNAASAASRDLAPGESRRLNTILDEMEVLHGQMAGARISELGNRPRPRVTGPQAIGATSSTHFTAFADFVRTGDRARFYNATSMTIAGGTDDGAATVPDLVASQVREIQKAHGAIRQLATVLPVSQPLAVPIATSLPGAQWRTETDTREDQTVPVIKQASLPGGSMSSVIPISDYLINDAAWPMESYVSGAIARAFGVTESAGFINGTGANGQVKGILQYTLAATSDASRTWGQLEKLHSGTSGGGLTPDYLLALSVKLDPSYRKNAAFVLHPATFSTLLQTKASTSGDYLLNPSADGTVPARIWGLPVYLDVNVPVAGASSASVLCGDFGAGYMIQQVGGLKVLRDPYATYGLVKIWCEQRIYGGVVDSNAIKVGVLAV